MLGAMHWLINLATATGSSFASLPGSCWVKSRFPTTLYFLLHPKTRQMGLNSEVPSFLPDSHLDSTVSPIISSRHLGDDSLHCSMAPLSNCPRPFQETLAHLLLVPSCGRYAARASKLRAHEVQQLSLRDCSSSKQRTPLLIRQIFAIFFSHPPNATDF